MTIQEQINSLDFLTIAQTYAPVDGEDVYVYSLSNEDINVRKTVANDFETWVVVFNHYDSITVILAGAEPVEHKERYTLLKYLENVVKPEPVVAPAQQEEVSQ